MPHGHCYLWEPQVLWMQVLANLLIGLAYVAIASTLAYLVFRIRDIPFKAMYLAFGVFIITCGFTHFLDVWVIWHPDYYLDGGVRVVTALASVGTALSLPPLVPKAIAIARGAKAAHDRGVELASMVDELARMYEKARDLEQQKTRFFANVSHELRTPLTLILGPVEKLARAENLSDEQRHDAEVALRNGRTLLRHVNDLLEIARLEAGKLEMQYAEVDLAKLVRVVAGHFESLAVDRAIQFSVETPAAMRAEVDPVKIDRVLLNLLSNAFKFTPAEGQIRVTLAGDRSEPGKALLEVADSGPGVPYEARQLVFERFRQLEATNTRAFGGTGLGLAICKDFVELHRGQIELLDAPEGGARFRVLLPLTAPASTSVKRDVAQEGYSSMSGIAVQVLEEFQTRPRRALPRAESSNPTVLVVEDNVEMNAFVCACLSDRFEPVSAYDGEEGYEKALSTRPDLIVTDLMMPKMSGDQLVKALRSRPDLDDTPIVLLSAKADDEMRVQLLQSGAQDYLMKPFSRDELQARVRNLVAVKRAKDLLRGQLATHAQGLEQLAAEVTARQRELRAALDVARVAKEQAEKASSVKTNFLRLVSHELRTPLTVIMLQVERLQAELGDALTEQHRRIITRIMSSSVRLTDLIESVLQHARIESGRLTMAVQRFDLIQLGEDVVDELRPQAEAKGLELKLAPVAALPVLQSDPKLVRLVLANLVSNAIKFTAQGGVTVRLGHEDSKHWLVVSDTGPGIAPEHQIEVFEPFVHLEPVRNKHVAGVGLGLALVREMVSALGGDIELDSDVGRGASFRVTLPVLAA